MSTVKPFILGGMASLTAEVGELAQWLEVLYQRLTVYASTRVNTTTTFLAVPRHGAKRQGATFQRIPEGLLRISVQCWILKI